MSNYIDIKTAARILTENDDFAILTHQNPDGDAFGSAFALCLLLKKLNKRVKVLNCTGFPERYSFLYTDFSEFDFEEKTVIAVDLADDSLLGDLRESYASKCLLNIDHHASNVGFAQNTLLHPKAAAAAEVVFDLAVELGIELDSEIAKRLYTAISTDTGCFKFSNTTSRTHEIVSKLLCYDFDFANINREMFDIKSIGKIKLEAAIHENTEYYFGGKCAIAFISRKQLEALGVEETELDTTMSLPLQTLGVVVCVTIKEREDGKYKASMRSVGDFSVSDVCAKFGGGGHKNAAGCEFDAENSVDEIKSIVVEQIGKVLNA